MLSTGNGCAGEVGKVSSLITILIRLIYTHNCYCNLPEEERQSAYGKSDKQFHQERGWGERL